MGDDKHANELIFEGLDVSKAALEVALDFSAKTRTLGNDNAGLKALVAELSAMKPRVAVVLLEATGGLERAAARALCTSGFAVMVVNLRQAHDFAKALGYPAKTDSTDARALSHFARTLYHSDRRERLLHRLPTPEQACCWPRSLDVCNWWTCGWLRGSDELRPHRWKSAPANI